QAVGFILSSSEAPTRPRVRLLKIKWIVRMSARSNSWSLDTRIAPAALAASGGMFWLQAIRFIPKALPTRATCDPIRPSPRTPKVFPRRSVPTVCCQPPDRTELLSVTICRAEAKISAQVNSIVGSELYPVWTIATPRSAAAATSIDAFTDPVEAMSLRLGRRSMTLRGSGVRSRMTQTTSKVSNRSITASGSARGFCKYGDVRSMTEYRPIGAFKRRILVIVQNSDFVLLHWHLSVAIDSAIASSDEGSVQQIVSL